MARVSPDDFNRADFVVEYFSDTEDANALQRKLAEDGVQISALKIAHMLAKEVKTLQDKQSGSTSESSAKSAPAAIQPLASAGDKTATEENKDLPESKDSKSSSPSPSLQRSGTQGSGLSSGTSLGSSSGKSSSDTK